MKSLAAGVLGALLLAGCASSPSLPPPTTNFEPLQYDYLTKLRLDVGRVDIDSSWLPRDGARHVEALSPVLPVQALAAMAEQRLLPAGSSGRASFIIDDASIIEDRSSYHARFAAHLTLLADDDRSLGSAEVQVTGVHPMNGRDASARRADLYDFTRTLMNAMNVELEFQLQRVVRDRLPATSATAPLPEAVQTQSLEPPPGSPPMAPLEAPPMMAPMPAPAPDEEPSP